ncbi:polysaccharide export protein [Roseobacter sp. HKCCD9010]|uniref:polysaccharide biosynthesis/export family protein n=1 Tax=unclassified Roseobacter TaxID=196798 RepID=UPI001199C3AC|nr:polysaccharide export protein [Rhodobacterales bacterium HKCCD4356]NNV10335.1 polysaccharide export protein [Roseobacter sp. HKCCD7357]NNV18155.1 polysaccharide export protein [Roseobacter sp. HKCCD8768]NNV27615.1 polysaccharide export protein [Roseobacter sp. HKCCD8192]NNV31881.1 polysaccharide export protein [Roseobacter sp. HKCCD9061]NNV36134.1 polysaccharide export protein [Roseobacter sp. HKCCD9073]NNV40392.1 polysaccharide export protein [Roseobacter sp. HKCCD9054]NNV44627.1 polysac
MKSLASRGARLVALSLVVSIVASCGLPRSGPTRNEIFAGSVQREGDAFVVEVNQRVIAATAVVPALGFSEAFQNAGAVSTEVIRPGDVLDLTIYENVEDGLLAGAGSNAATISEVTVDSSGFIFVPYAGRIRAAGNTPNQLREILTRNLDEQTPDPQVLIRRAAGDGATVSVAGGVGGQGIYPIERPTRTLTGMLSAAGGISVEPDIAQITVVRGAHTGTIWFEDLYSNPQFDIAMRGGDRILVEEDGRSFTSLGATGQQARVPFDSQTISAIEAIATVGGLNTSLADPTGVFVLRNEPEEIASQVLGRSDLIGAQRMIYVLDLTAPTGMFEARDFVIRDGDTVYVTEAPFTQWSKALNALTGTLGTANSLSSLGGD